jgi:hypothetical protein
VNAGIEHFKRAIELDPGYAPAYVGTADSYIVLENFGTYRSAGICLHVVKTSPFFDELRDTTEFTRALRTPGLES